LKSGTDAAPPILITVFSIFYGPEAGYNEICQVC
jgi:hypothetical protein